MDFLAVLRIRGPGDPFFGIWDPAGVSFTSTPRGGGSSGDPGKGGFGTPLPGRGGSPGTAGPRRDSGVRVPPPGNRGAPPRGVDVKPLLARRPETPDPGSGILGIPRSGNWASQAPGATRGTPPGSRTSGPGDLRGPGPRDPAGSPDRGPEPEKGSPAPGGEVVLHQPLAAGPHGSAGPGDHVRPHVAWSHSWPPRALSVLSMVVSITVKGYAKS